MIPILAIALTTLLITIIILCVVIYAVKILLDFLELDPRLRQLVMLIVFVVALIFIVSVLKGGGSLPFTLN